MSPVVLIRLIERLLNFPYPTICRHLVACDLLNILEIHGYPVSPELSRAVVGAQDEQALVELAKLPLIVSEMRQCRA